MSNAGSNHFHTFREAMFVVAAGAVGGALSWVFAKTVGIRLATTSLWSVPACILVGMGASSIGVFLVANADTRAIFRCLGFAMVCGCSRQAIYQAGDALIDRQIAEQSNRKLGDLTSDVDDAISSVDAAGGSERPAKLEQLAQLSAELVQRSDTVEDY